MKLRMISLFLLAIIVLISCDKQAKEQVKSNSKEITTILVPKTPSGIPYYLAAKNSAKFDVEFFMNHSSANARFLRNDVSLMLMGVSVANSFAKQNVDFQVVNSTVDNLTYMVSKDLIVDLQDIKGKTLIFPFKDAPMEQLFTAIAKKKDLRLNRDYKVKYLPISSSMHLIQQKSDYIIFLPEPFLTKAIYTFKAKFITSLDELYKKEFANNHASQVVLMGRNVSKDILNELNDLVSVYCDSLVSNPDLMMSRIEDYPNYENYHKKSLERTTYHFQSGKTLKKSINNLYKNIKKDLYFEKNILEFD